jgi:AcrB/AcrD/AcrF family
MANFFINRPVFAWVIAIILMMAGALSITNLPVAQYPSIAPPAVSITASTHSYYRQDSRRFPRQCCTASRPSATPTPVMNPPAEYLTSTVPNDNQTTPNVLYIVPDLKRLVGKPLDNAGSTNISRLSNGIPTGPFSDHALSKSFRAILWFVVHFDLTDENRRAGTSISFPKQSPLRILSAKKKASGGILVTARC